MGSRVSDIGARETATRSISWPNRTMGTAVAFEVKASQRVERKELAGLRKLRDAVGDAFTAGLVLHLGERSYTAEDRLHVVPVDQLWN